MGSTAVSSSGASPARIYHHLEAAHTITMERRATTYASSSQGPQDHKYDSDTSEMRDQMSEIFAVASSPQCPQDHNYDSDTSARMREIVAGAASSSQAPQPQHHNFYNWPNLDLLPSKCDHSYEYRLKCVPLHNAALKGDWEEAKRLLLTNHINDPPSIMLRTAISERYETALHVATGAKQIAFVLEIIELMEPEDLTLQDLSGNTAFYLAAATGTIEIAEAMLTRNSALLSIRGSWNMTPLYTAVLLGKMEMATLLYDRTIMYLLPDDKAYLFFQSILTDLYDMALKLLKNRPELAVFRDENDETALHVLARKPSSIFKMKSTRNSELMIPSPALELLKCLLEEAIRQKGKDDIESVTKYPIPQNGKDYINSLIGYPSNLLFDAAKSGNSQFLTELIRSYPFLVHELDENSRSIFHVAILHRHISTFNLIYEMGFDKELLTTFVDADKNTMLHLAAKYPYHSPVGGLSSAALEMQQELLLFEEVEKLMQPSFRKAKNAEGLTPRDLFSIEHKMLMKSGEKWMRNTASSCMVVATLIATVVFSAAFTVPGDYDDKTGTPLLLEKDFFLVFVISDAVALSSSSFSILTFLSILTSGYAETDFHRSLPLKLMIGLLALFTSIIFMMITFSSTYFLLYHHRSISIPILALMFVSLPTTLFFMLQYPLLKDLFLLTNRSGFLRNPFDKSLWVHKLSK